MLSLIFDLAMRETSKSLKLQLLSAFVQTLHLCTKMVIPRNEAANRDYSGSWGRPDYIVRRRQMEQNPLVVFLRSCRGRQGVVPMMRDAVASFPHGLKLHDVRSNKKLKKTADINYGVVDISDLKDFVPKGFADFAITDPPYAGLIRYLPLSVVWLSWLKKFDKKYNPDLSSEITVEKNSVSSRNNYRGRLRNAFSNVNYCMNESSKLVVTFHHQDVREFNDFVIAVKSSGFRFEKVTHQFNRRSGESNVANPYGVSASDFYVRCIKRDDVQLDNSAKELRRYILETAILIIARRNEPTPYTFLFQSLWPELLQAGYVQPKDSRDEITAVLTENEGPGKTFCRSVNTSPNMGDLWWFNNPSDHISYPDRPLADRVVDSVTSYMRRHTSAKLDDVIGNLFKEYPNGLTPDPRSISTVLQNCALRSQGKWKIRADVLAAASKHSDVIHQLLTIGAKINVTRFVGRREQPEYSSLGVRLRDVADIADLSLLGQVMTNIQIQRMEMVDTVFLDKSHIPQIVCLWEVENSTNFTSAIQRGSNASAGVPKFMVLPDAREAELLRIVDPFFKIGFVQNGWRYLTYSDVERLARYSGVTLNDIITASKSI